MTTKHTIVAIALVLGSAAAPVMLRAQSGYDLFQKALATERADGNLREAIELYARVAREFAADRALAARALLRMADCYEKLGNPEAARIYERVTRDYADQRAAVEEARAYLRTNEDRSRGKSMVSRKVWSGPQVAPEGSVSADGRFVTYPAWDVGDLGLHDLVTGKSRLLTHNGYAHTQYAQGSAISRDSRRVAYAWYNGADRYQLRVVPVTETGTAEPRIVYNNPDVNWLWPFEWSPDDKTIAVWLQRKDHTSQIALLSVADGSMRILKSLDWRGAERLSFSPDGKYLGFDVIVSDTDSNERDVFAIAVDGSREHPVVQHPGHDRMMGWSQDGRTLLFASDRTGTLGLWGIPVMNGAATGPAFAIKTEIAPISYGTTRSGTLFTLARIGTQDVKTASVDLPSGRLTAGPESAVRGVIGANRFPDWSPDGKSLAYISNRSVTSRDRVIVIRSLDDGRTRELRILLNYSGQLRWTPDSRAFILAAKDLRGRDGVYRIDAQTGALTQLVSLSSEAGSMIAQISADGTKLYYWRGEVLRATPGSAYVEHDLATGAERVIFADGWPVYPSLSPDGRYLVGVVNDEQTRRTTVVLVTVSSGERKEVYAAPEFGSLSYFVNWTPDGQQVVVPVRQAGSYEGLLVPVFGGAPRRLGFEIGQLGVRFHPDGRQIAFTTGRGMLELWALENFLPPATGTR